MNIALRNAIPYIKLWRSADPPHQAATGHQPRREGLLTILILPSLLHINHTTI